MKRLNNRKPLLDKKSYKAVFFDFGDTLSFNNQTFTESLHKILKSIGVCVNEKQLRSAILEADYGELQNDRMKARKRDLYRDFRIKYYKYVLNLLSYSHMEQYAEYIQNTIGYYHKSYLRPETNYVLDVLKKEGYTLGIVSNFSHALPWICHELGLTEKFDFITYSDDVGCEKPAPEIFYDALNKAKIKCSQLKPEQVIHIGDSYSADILGAKALGITPILITNNTDKVYEDCICIDNLIEILNIMRIEHSFSDKTH